MSLRRIRARSLLLNDLGCTLDRHRRPFGRSSPSFLFAIDTLKKGHRFCHCQRAVFGIFERDRCFSLLHRNNGIWGMNEKAGLPAFPYREQRGSEFFLWMEGGCMNKPEVFLCGKSAKVISAEICTPCRTNELRNRALWLRSGRYGVTAATESTMESPTTREDRIAIGAAINGKRMRQRIAQGGRPACRKVHPEGAVACR